MLKSLVLAALTAQGYAASHQSSAKASMKTDGGNVLIRVDEGKTIAFQNGNTSTGDIGAKLANQDALLTTLGEQQNLADLTADTRDGTIADLAQRVTEQIAAQKAASTFSEDLAQELDDQGTKITAIEGSITAQGKDIDEVSEDVDALEKDFTAALACMAANGVYSDDGKCAAKPKRTFGMAGNFKDARESSCWRVPGGRTGKVQRTDGSKAVKVSYFDTIGYKQTRQTTGVRFRMLINGRAYREHWTHSSNGKGWRVFPMTTFNYYTNTEIPGGGSDGKWYSGPSSTFDWEIQACRQSGSSTTAFGWDGSENGVTFQEVDSNLMSVKRYMRDTRPSRTSWESIRDRSVSYTVKTTGSMLEITYSDVMGMYQTKAAEACGLRLLINNKPHPYEHRMVSAGNWGWRINPTSMKWITKAEMKKGTKLKFQFQNKRMPGTSSQCLYGWANNQVHNTFMVEEITPDAQKLMAVSSPGSFGDVRDKSKTWTNVAGRTLAYTKKTASSLMKITLSDQWGFNQVSESKAACQVRALVNGKTYDMGLQQSAATSEKGWFFQQTVFTWVCKTCPAGKNTVTIQSQRDDGASECIFGGSFKDDAKQPTSKAGFLKTEEYFESA